MEGVTREEWAARKPGSTLSGLIPFKSFMDSAVDYTLKM